MSVHYSARKALQFRNWCRYSLKFYHTDWSYLEAQLIKTTNSGTFQFWDPNLEIIAWKCHLYTANLGQISSKYVFWPPYTFSYTFCSNSILSLHFSFQLFLSKFSNTQQLKIFQEYLRIQVTRQKACFCAFWKDQ